jgi:osmotically inducible protein OsmC
MADIERTGTAVWTGSLREGKGTLSVESAALRDEAYSFGTRFEDGPGTNPEELIGAAHAGCYSMALANVLHQEGYEVEGLETTATVHLEKTEGGFAITKSALEVQGRVPDLDQETFEQLAEKADAACPVSNLLRPGLEIEIEAMLA